MNDDQHYCPICGMPIDDDAEILWDENFINPEPICHDCFTAENEIYLDEEVDFE